MFHVLEATDHSVVVAKVKERLSVSKRAAHTFL